MCDLITALTIGSTLIGAAGQMQQASAAASAAEYNAAVQRENANRAERQSRQVLEAGMREEQKQRAQASALLGKQTAAMAANGVDVTFGSPLDLLVDTSKQGEADALTIRTNAYRNYDDVRAQATAYRNQASLYDMEASNSRTAGMLNAFGTVIGGVGSAYKSYKQNSIGKIA